METKVNKIVRHHAKYNATTHTWFKMTKEGLEKWAGNWSDGHMDKTLTFDEENLLIGCKFAGTHTECRFTYKPGLTILTFGFIKKNREDNESFEEVSQQYIDVSGNVRSEPSASSASNINIVDDPELRFADGLFLELIYDAMEAAWQQQDQDKTQPKEQAQ